VNSVDDIFTIVGANMPGNDIITYANNSPVGMTFHGGGGQRHDHDQWPERRLALWRCGK
jgi:hypothetical protein